MSRARAVLLALSAAAALVGGGVPAARARGAAPILAGGRASLAPLVAKASPAVVSIVNLELAPDQNPLLSDPVLRQLVPGAGAERSLAVRGIGSGVIIDAAHGLVVTNNHVVNNADRLLVQLSDGRKLHAKVIGTDEPTDLAVLRVPAADLASLPLGDSDRLSVGDVVVAIGDPFGLGETVTSGVVSALGRSGLGIEGFEDFIQTDAAINPGNSGGALVDLDGALVGINTAILAPNGTSVGIGFAIPINMVKVVVAQLVAHGSIERGQLGAQTQVLTPELARYFHVPNGKGVVVTAVEKGASADAAGIRPGDVITAIDGVKVVRGNELVNVLGLMRVGTKAKLRVLRHGEARDVELTLTEPTLERIAVDPRVIRLAGVVLGQTDASHLGDQPGLLVIAVPSGSKAWEAGLRPGDVIGEADQKKVKTVTPLLEAARAPGPLLLTVRRADARLYLVIE